MATIADIITGAAQRYGVDPQALLRVAEIESRLDPSAQNKRSSAGGLFQFVDDTAADYGLADRFDPVQASDAGARLMRDNAQFLRKRLGRDPSPAELYLAHQQGAGGAARILGNPSAPLASLVGEKAALLNAGKGLTAGQFAQKWLSKFMGGSGEMTGGPAPGQVQTQAPQQVAGGMAPPASRPPEQIDPALFQSFGGFSQPAPQQQQTDPRQAEAEAKRRALLGSIGEMYA